MCAHICLLPVSTVSLRRICAIACRGGVLTLISRSTLFEHTAVRLSCFQFWDTQKDDVNVLTCVFGKYRYVFCWCVPRSGRVELWNGHMYPGGCTTL